MIHIQREKNGKRVLERKIIGEDLNPARTLISTSKYNRWRSHIN